MPLGRHGSPTGLRARAPWPQQPLFPQEPLLIAPHLGRVNSLKPSVKSLMDVWSGPSGRCMHTHLLSLTHLPRVLESSGLRLRHKHCRRQDSSPQLMPTRRPSGTTTPPHQCTCAFVPTPALCVPVPRSLSPAACEKWRSRAETPQRPRAPPFRLLPACHAPREEVLLGATWD